MRLGGRALVEGKAVDIAARFKGHHAAIDPIPLHLTKEGDPLGGHAGHLQLKVLLVGHVFKSRDITLQQDTGQEARQGGALLQVHAFGGNHRHQGLLFLERDDQRGVVFCDGERRIHLQVQAAEGDGAILADGAGHRGALLAGGTGRRGRLAGRGGRAGGTGRRRALRQGSGRRGRRRGRGRGAGRRAAAGRQGQGKQGAAGARKDLFHHFLLKTDQFRGFPLTASITKGTGKGKRPRRRKNNPAARKGGPGGLPCSNFQFCGTIRKIEL